MDIPAVPAVEIVDLTVNYDARPALVSINACIARGAQVGVVGPNGAGKSTLFKAIAGLIEPSSGSMSICGKAPQRHAAIAYVPQREEIDWRFPVSVLDVVLMGRYGKLGWLRRPGQAERAVARRCLGQLGIEHLARRPIGELSGGQQQRVFLARALAQEPEILLLDEPFAGVDRPTEEVVLALLSDLRGQAITLLVSTHDLTLAASHFDYLLLLNRRLFAFGPPSEVLTPANLAAAFGTQSFFHNKEAGFSVLTMDHCSSPTPADAAREEGA